MSLSLSLCIRDLLSGAALAKFLSLCLSFCLSLLISSLSLSQLSVSFRLMYNMESAVNAASTVYLSCIGIPEEWMQ